MLKGCRHTMILRGSGPAAGPARHLPVLSGIGSQKVLGAGACLEVVFENTRAAACLCVWLVPTSLILLAKGWLLVGILCSL